MKQPIKTDIIYKSCKCCTGKKTLMCDEYEDGEYYNFCIRCGYCAKDMDDVKAETSKCQGTLRYASKDGQGFQIGPLDLPDIEPFTVWVNENKDKLDYAHITFAYGVDDKTKWVFHNLITNEQTDYEIKKDYLFGNDIKKESTWKGIKEKNEKNKKKSSKK